MGKSKEDAEPISRVLIGEDAPVYNGFRTHLPTEMKFKTPPGILQILKDCVGKELSRIAMPITLNEPLTLIQRFAENLEYVELLYKALESENSIERLQYVSAFVISGLSGILDRIGKPFNPILGETYELVHPDGSCRFFAEQVSHHPPISVFNIEDIKGRFKLTGSCQPKLKFTGRTVTVQVKNFIEIELTERDGETYTYGGIDCVIDNLFIGRPRLEYDGTFLITNKTTDECAKVQVFPSSFFGKKKRANEIEGYTFDNENNKKSFIYGFCNSKMIILPYKEKVHKQQKEMSRATTPGFKISNGEDMNDDESPTESVKNGVGEGPSGGDQEKRVSNPIKQNTDVSEINPTEDRKPSSSSQDDSSDSENNKVFFEEKLIWNVKARPTWCKNEYSFTSFAIILNEITADISKQIENGSLPSTDSRLRPDMRLFENGDWEEAAKEKLRLEEKQREAEKARIKNKEEWVPQWFYWDETNNKWVSKDTYWQRNYSNSLDIF